MTLEEHLELIREALIEGQLSAAEIVDKYCNWVSSEKRDLLILDLEELKRLYHLKNIIND